MRKGSSQEVSDKVRSAVLRTLFSCKDCCDRPVLSGKARVNSISPGWIDTTGTEITGEDAVQQPVGRVGRPEDIAELILFLCSKKAGFITGENICVDGGMTKLMIYHNDYGWQYQPDRQ